MAATSKEVLKYLKHLSDIKARMKPPVSLEIDENIYHLMDGNGIRVMSVSKKIYEIFNEL